MTNLVDLSLLNEKSKSLTPPWDLSVGDLIVLKDRYFLIIKIMPNNHVSIRRTKKMYGDKIICCDPLDGSIHTKRGSQKVISKFIRDQSNPHCESKNTP